MVKQGILKVHNGDVTSAVNDFLKELLQSGKVSALLVPQTVPSKKVVFPVFISNHDKLDANVFAPLLPVSEAKMISKITKFQPSEKPIGVVMHPCQISAVIELVKLNQAHLDNIIIIGVDCLGTFPVNVYADLAEKKNPLDIILDDFKSNSDTSEQYLRSACVVCTQPVPINADIVIGVLGMDLHKEILIEAVSESGKKIIEDLKLDSVKDVKKREKHINDYIERKTKKLDAFIKEKTEKSDIERLTTLFDKCVNCHNCMNVCPICYCRECLFDSSVFDAEAYKYVKKSESKGLFKMPNDSLLFHLGRMNHMILSCVACGLCEQGCPMDIALMDVFIPTAKNAQKQFKYHPGKDPTEKIPMVVYREDEYVEVGEK